MEGSRGKNRQVVLASTKLLRFPRVGEGVGVQLGVAKHLLELGVIKGAVDRGVYIFAGGEVGGWANRGGYEGAPCGPRGGPREGTGGEGGWTLVRGRCGGTMGAVGRAVGVVVITPCDRSCREDWTGRMSSWVATSFAILEERSCRLERSPLFSFRISVSWLVAASS